MQAALKLNTTVLPGHRIEITATELFEGETVELIVLRSEDVPTVQKPHQFASALDYLNSLTPVPRTLEEWAAVEREIQEEKNAWDR